MSTLNTVSSLKGTIPRESSSKAQILTMDYATEQGSDSEHEESYPVPQNKSISISKEMR